MGAPPLSVVVAGSRRDGPVKALVDALADDARTGAIELLFATARPHAAAASCGRLLRFAPGTTVPRLRALGLAEARGEIVALTEDFCAPSPGWARALLEAHARQAGAVAVGGPMDRRDGGPAAWALTFCEYGRFLRRGPAGPVADLPGTNVSYKKDRLREALGALPEDFAEVFVHERLRACGATLWLEPAAVVWDEETRPLTDAARALYHHGRLFGGRRLAGRGAGHRLLRLAASPLVPAVQLRRIASAARAAGRSTESARALPALALLLAAWAAGEGVGSACGEGRSAARWT